MNLLKNLWKKLLYLLITGSTSIFIAACYGMPANFNVLGHWIIKTRDQNNNPIIGLKVDVLHYTGVNAVPDTMEHGYTDSSGEIWSALYLREDTSKVNIIKALIHDADSTENGGAFADTLLAWDGRDEAIVFMRNRP
jgi:hypothetical protein